jgi:hypothetical protein
VIKDSDDMIKYYINQYEHDMDHEFDVNSVDDIKYKIIKEEIDDNTSC